VVDSPSELLEEDTNVHVLLGVENGHLAREKSQLYGYGLTKAVVRMIAYYVCHTPLKKKKCKQIVSGSYSTLMCLINFEP